MNWNSSPLPQRRHSASLTVVVVALLALLGGQVLAAPVVGASVPGRAGASSPAEVVAAAAPPQGKLTPRGCAVSGADATCELWAKTGTTTILGQSMPIWGYATSAAGTPTAPGPVLVVTQGQTVHVVLHNELPQQSALAFPGQESSAFTTPSPGGVVGGVPNGGSETYSFTAARPGTFLYEAGHTPDGARQVALGLAGALVVLPATGPGAYGTTESDYQDEAVLVLSELDPALNQAVNPATFDMRQFQARYRMINGKVYPSTDPVATGTGRTVLLRYVNAGALPHAMELLGGTQLRLALDGHPAESPVSSLVADLTPGSTMDTVVSMPAQAGSELTLYEAGGHLDNNGMTEADPTRIATGGMITVLDTEAPLPSPDAVGPVPSRLTVTPNPSDGTVPVVVTADLSDATTGGGVVDAAELVVDDATSQQPGFGLAMQATGGGFGTTSVHVTGTIPVGTASDTAYCAANPITLTCLSAGRHRIFVRGHDANGNWGVISDVLFNLPKIGPLSKAGAITPDPTNGANGADIEATGDDSSAGGTIDDAEWSLDTLAAAGSGTALTVNGGGTVAALTGHIPAAAFTSLAEGTHHVFVRSHDSLGLWGPELDIPFTVDKTGPAVNAAAVAPNPTNGQLDDPGNPGNLVVSASITDAAGGIVVGAEGFLDPGLNPTPGTGFGLLATDGNLDSGAESVYGLIPLTALNGLADGNHRVVVRGRDDAGNWGEVFTAPLEVDRVAPNLGALTASPNPTNGSPTVALSGSTSESGLNAAEVWVGADPGKGKATPATISVNPAGTLVTVTVAVPPFTVGPRVVNVRIQDTAGNWSNARSRSITVRGGNPPAGSAAALLGFGAQTGNVTSSTTAGIPQGGGNRGMLVTAGSNAPAYVSTTVANPAHRVQLSFRINRNTLRTVNNGVITLVDGRTSSLSGNGVLAVQMRTTSSTAAQIRGVLTRSNGTAVTGAWVNFPAGAHVVTVTWVSGPTNGANRGQLRVTRDNTVVANLFADTSARALTTLRLGAVDATTTAARNGMTGSMFIDDYTATGVQ